MEPTRCGSCRSAWVVAEAPLKFLVLGGTGFLGGHIVTAAQQAGHSITVFHRGRTGAAPHGVEEVLGDREREPDLEPLRGRRWDAVIDTSGYQVPAVRTAALALADAEHWVYVSSVSVYADLRRRDEDAPVLRLPDGIEVSSAPLSPATYGALKAACERVLSELRGGRVQHVRAGIIVGPHDYDDRFSWLLRRVARGGEMAAPGDPDAPVELIDARDLAAWIVRCAQGRVSGAFNATGPGAPLTMRGLLELLRDVTRPTDLRLTWVPDEILLAQGVAPYSEMPFWIPASLGAVTADKTRALAAGLTHRPVADTVADTWRWLCHDAGSELDRSIRRHRRLAVPAGISVEREQSLLRATRRA